MKRSTSLLLAAATAVSVSACDGLKEAFTAHVDVVARAGGQELSTEHLATIMGNAQIPVQPDIAKVLTEVWVSYQLLGHAAARGDSLNDPKLIDEAMWSALSQMKISKFYDITRRSFPPADTTNLEQKYAQSDGLAAQHILVMLPEGGAGLSDAKKAEIKSKAEGILRRATTANFSALVKQYSEDEGSKANNGTYAIFRPGEMVPDFERAVRATKPGEIAPALVQTNYGFHIIRRHTLDEVRLQFVDWLVGNTEMVGRNQFIDKLTADGKLVVKPTVVAKTKEFAKDPLKFEDDRTVLATSRLGNFTGAKFVRWVQAHPQGPQLRDAIVNRMPDSTVLNWVRGFVTQELILAEAEKKKVELDSLELDRVRSAFVNMVTQSWMGLRVDPKTLGDSGATSVAERERLAATRADEAVDRILATNAQDFVDIPQQLAWALRKKYSARINQAGLDRTVERALALRSARDSADAKQAPANPGQPQIMTPPPPGLTPPAAKKGGE
ncbi:MAG TPA: peptidylprolyl isomerase [Gemmatimonadaceae bacterium]|nr:peptidylprolyl isomerase [Gemmatimonadaceae bacterium]